MRKPLLKLLPVAAAALAMSGACIIFPNAGDREGWRTIPERKSEAGKGTEFRETVDLRPGDTLSLENDYGNVDIKGWDRDAVEIIATVVTPESRTQRSGRDSRAQKYTPDVEIRETNDGLLVRTRTFEGTGDPPRVDYELRVPNSVTLTGLRISEGNLNVSDVFGRLEASLDQGDLTVENYSGAVDANVGTGNADVEVLDLREEDSITIACRRGDIVLRLESGAGAIVEADAPRGRVRSDFDLGEELPATTVKGWIGEGGPNIILRATNGRIEIVEIKAPAADAATAKGE
jgi:hypothetical protein